EGPVLAAEILEVAHVDTHLLHDFPAQRLFRRLAGLDEAGPGTEETAAEVGRACQQHLIATGDQHYYARRQLGVLAVAARRALHGPFIVPQVGPSAAASTEAMGVIPDIQLLGDTEQAEGGVVHVAQQPAQPLPGKTRQVDLLLDPHKPARTVI